MNLRSLNFVVILGVLPTGAYGQSRASSVSIQHIESVEYPWLANLARVEGRVEIVAQILRDGSVAATRAESGHPLLVDASKAAVAKWRFSPCSAKGRCEVVVHFVFALEGECDRDRCPTEFSVDLPSLLVNVRTRAAPAIIN